MYRFNGGSKLASFRNPFRIVSDSNTEMARVQAHGYTREVERQQKIMMWATIYNQPTFQFGEILIEERRDKDLKQG